MASTLWTEIPVEKRKPRFATAETTGCLYGSRHVEWNGERYVETFAPCASPTLKGSTVCSTHAMDGDEIRHQKALEARALNAIRRNIPSFRNGSPSEFIWRLRRATDHEISGWRNCGGKLSGIVREIRDTWTDPQILAAFRPYLGNPIDHGLKDPVVSISREHLMTLCKAAMIWTAELEAASRRQDGLYDERIARLNAAIKAADALLEAGE